MKTETMTSCVTVLLLVLAAPTTGLAQDSRWKPVSKKGTTKVSSPGARGRLLGEKAKANSKTASKKASAKSSNPMEISDQELKDNYKTELDRSKPLSSEERAALQTAESFYKGLQGKNFKEIQAVLDPKVHFRDPAFPNLKGRDAEAMWHLITENKPLKLTYKIYKVDGDTVYGGWVADYELFGNKIHNVIRSKLTIKNGKITHHRDVFDLDLWAEQALPGFINTPLNWLGKNHKKRVLNFITGLSLKSFKRNNGY